MGQPHFIIFANEKGGTGKSTTAVHTAVALAASGHRVGALDLDQRQRTMTRYLDNRAATIKRLGIALPQPAYEVLEDVSEAALEAAITRLAADTDVIVIDTPGRDDPVSRAAWRFPSAISARCPSCSAPMVGTSENRSPSARQVADASTKSLN